MNNYEIIRKRILNAIYEFEESKRMHKNGSEMYNYYEGVITERYEILHNLYKYNYPY